MICQTQCWYILCNTCHTSSEVSEEIGTPQEAHAKAEGAGWQLTPYEDRVGMLKDIDICPRCRPMWCPKCEAVRDRARDWVHEDGRRMCAARAGERLRPGSPPPSCDTPLETTVPVNATPPPRRR